MEHNIEFNYYIFADVNEKIPIAGFMDKKIAYDFLNTCKSGTICISKEYLDDQEQYIMIINNIENIIEKYLDETDCYNVTRKSKNWGIYRLYEIFN